MEIILLVEVLSSSAGSQDSGVQLFFTRTGSTCVSISLRTHTSTEQLSNCMSLHLESVKLDEIFVDHETCALRYPDWSEFYTFSPVWPVWSGPKNIHNHAVSHLCN